MFPDDMRRLLKDCEAKYAITQPEVVDRLHNAAQNQFKVYLTKFHKIQKHSLQRLKKLRNVIYLSMV